MTFSLFLLLLLFPDGVAATQNFTVRDGATVTAIVSSKELTRVSVAGNARLEKVWAPAGHLQIQPDAAQGDIFIKPAVGAPAAMSFFVRDSAGGTYTIIAQQHDVPSETIILKPHLPVAGPSQNRPRPNQKPFSYVSEIKRLMLAMALHRDVKGFTWEDHDVAVPLWQETKILQIRTYTGFHFIGHVYRIENLTAQPLTLHEQEFLDFVPHTRAVALRHYTLPSGASTSLYVVLDTRPASSENTRRNKRTQQ